MKASLVRGAVRERYIKGNVCVRCKKDFTEAYRNTFRGKEAMGNAKRNRINDMSKTERTRSRRYDK